MVKRARIVSALTIVSAGAACALISTFIGKRSATAAYSDIMGCEAGCVVVATGWPLKFVFDYPGMSVGNRADISEVWFAADRFDWAPFVTDVAFWGAVIYLLSVAFKRALLGAKRG